MAVASLVWAWPVATAAQQAADADSVAESIRVGATIFYDYTYTTSPTETDAAGQEYSPSAFNVKRTYINVRGRLAPNVEFRITPDIKAESGSGSSLEGSLSFRLKYGYAQFNLAEWTGPWTNTWVRGGIQQTPYISGQESVYRYRFQGTSFTERDGGLRSADAGVTMHADLPGGYGDVHGGLYNGEGYSGLEENGQKALMLRGTVRPLPDGDEWTRGLRLTAYVHQDQVVDGADRNRFVGAVWYEHPRFNAGFDYMTRDDQAAPGAPSVESGGYSVFVNPFFQEKGNGFEGLFRFDVFTPGHARDARTTRTIAGLAYWFPNPGGSAEAALLIDVERVSYHDFPEPRTADQRVFVHGLIDF